MNQMTNQENQDLSTIVMALQQLLLSTQNKDEDIKPLVLTAKNAADELQVSLLHLEAISYIGLISPRYVQAQSI